LEAKGIAQLLVPDHNSQKDLFHVSPTFPSHEPKQLFLVFLIIICIISLPRAPNNTTRRLPGKWTAYEQWEIIPEQ